MLDLHSIQAVIPQALNGIDLPALGPKHSGKVRDYYILPEGRRVLVTTDRLSAFDRVLGLVPYKGQVLNQLSAFWFERTRHITDNHLLVVARLSQLYIACYERLTGESFQPAPYPAPPRIAASLRI